MGYHLGGGQVRPRAKKTAAIASYPCPKTKKEVRQFLGLPGYYCQFVSGFADLTSSLTDLTRKGASDLILWMEWCQVMFVQVKKALYRELLLNRPNFSFPLILQKDDSKRGLLFCPSR